MKRDTEKREVMDFSDNSKVLNLLPWRCRIFLHDCLIHPLAGFLWLMNIEWMTKAAYKLHNKTAPMLCRLCERRFDAERCPRCGGELE